MSDRRPILVVAGARPNFMKVAPIIAELERRDAVVRFVHTGQHYDQDLSQSILDDLGVRTPDFHLGVGSGSHAAQTARIMESFEPVITEVRPEWLVVVGDVNSTLACALVASKLRDALGCRIAHVEAGLRSYDWGMPEEVNRVLTDRLADVLLTPSTDAHENLAREGIDSDRVVFVGNVMVDSLLATLEKARQKRAATNGANTNGVIVATLHRPANVDNADRLREILSGLATVAHERPVILALHPRTKARISEFGLSGLLDKIDVRPPVGYVDMVGLIDTAAAVLTDSGGLQEETTVLGIPCVTLRDSTERPVTVSHGTNELIAWPPTATDIVRRASSAAQRRRLAIGERAPEGWDGRAAVRIADALQR
jgi:UDP-N-acetylglucosamine 2-epimerase (non-hydrolysing)